MTVTANPTGGPAQISWAQGAVPSAPTHQRRAPPVTAPSVSPSPQPAADPAVTSYTLTATPQGGGAAVTQTGAASPITLTGLVNGTTYDLSLTATNAAGTSTAGHRRRHPDAPLPRRRHRLHRHPRHRHGRPRAGSPRPASPPPATAW